MASNYTEHYKLNQWELSDSVIMKEFNANDIDQNQLGKCSDFPLTDDQIQDALKDNPCGQGDEMTPIILIRPIK